MRLAAKTFFVVGIILIIWTIRMFPLHRIDSKELRDNPARARYYIGLESILANYQLLSADKANVKFIKSRLMQFENDLKRESHRHADVTASYKDNYYKILQAFGVPSIKRINKNAVIISIAKQAADVVDGFYMDARLFHINPLYQWDASHSRRILQYNLGGLFNEIPSRYMRILAAYTNDSQLGVYSGFFVNNQTTTMETQFMTGMPMLTALYVMPKYDYNLTGSLDTMVPWGYFGSQSMVDPVIRKALDVSGVDIFGLLKSQMRSRNISTIPDAVAIKSGIRQSFTTDYVPYINNRSYGMAYLANHITIEQPSDIKQYEDVIKYYFSHPIDHDPAMFINTTNLLYIKLLNLKEKHDIILESLSPAVGNENMPAGSAEIKGLVGERILLNSDCERDNCTLVLNVADAPGWHAYVNGKSTPISRANFAFMAIDVPNGKSNVWFIYSPLSSMITYFLSIMTLLWMFLVCQKSTMSRDNRSKFE